MAETPEVSFIGQSLADRFLVERKIGQGPVATVYRAEDRQSGRPVAIKIFNPLPEPEDARIGRFLSDLQAAQGLHNAHLVPALALGRHETRFPYVVEPLLSAMSAADRLDQMGPLDAATVVRVAGEVLAGLDALHRAGLLHLDIKPSNIFLIADPMVMERAVLGGIGTHHLLCLENAPAKLPGECLARPEYLAPELVGGRTPDERTDIYLMGLVLYELLAGRPPFHGGNFKGTARRHALEKPLSPKLVRPQARITDALDAAVMQCLEKKPELRFASASALARALEDVARAGFGGGTPAPVRVTGTPAPGLRAWSTPPPAQLGTWSTSPAPLAPEASTDAAAPSPAESADAPPSTPSDAAAEPDAAAEGAAEAPVARSDSTEPGHAAPAEATDSLAPADAGPAAQLAEEADDRAAAPSADEGEVPEQAAPEQAAPEQATPEVGGVATASPSDDSVKVDPDTPALIKDDAADDPADDPADEADAAGDGAVTHAGEVAGASGPPESTETSDGAPDESDESPAGSDAGGVSEAPGAVASAEQRGEQSRSKRQGKKGKKGKGADPVAQRSPAASAATTATTPPSASAAKRSDTAPTPDAAAPSAGKPATGSGPEGSSTAPKGQGSSSGATSPPGARAAEKSGGRDATVTISGVGTHRARHTTIPPAGQSGEHLIGEAEGEDWFVESTEQLEQKHAKLTEYHFEPEKERSFFPWVMGTLVILVAATFLYFGTRPSPAPVAKKEQADASVKVMSAHKPTPRPDAAPPPPPPPAADAAPSIAALEDAAPAAADAARAAAPSPDAAAVVDPAVALEAAAREAFESERWTGAEDALAPTLARLRGLNADNATSRQLSKQASQRLIGQGDALRRTDPVAARERYKTALAVAPGDRAATARLNALDVADDEARKAAAEAEARDAAAAEKRRKAAEEAEAKRQKAAEEAEAKRLKAAEAAAERKRKAEEAAKRQAAATPTPRAAAPRAAKPPAPERDPAEAQRLTQEGDRHLSAGKFDAASKAYSDAVKAGAGAPAHAGLGRAAFKKGNNADALRHSSKAVQLNPRSADYRVDLGMVYFKQNKYGEARKQWDQALKLQPGHATATRYLAVLDKRESSN